MMKLFLLAALLSVSGQASAHELRSAVLRLDERAGGQVEMSLKTPLARDGAPVAVVPRFQPACMATGEARVERLAGFVLREWRTYCPDGIGGRTLRIEGLDPRTPDAIVTALFSDGRELTSAVDRHDPSLHLLPAAAVVPPGLLAYLPIGVEHILLGPDHLLFVLGLMLVVLASGRGLRMLVAAVTAFTVAHSLTLALAVLGVWGLPPQMVELLIALSIVLLAYELATRARRHSRGLPPSLTLRKPWLVAFSFGLLHGFGFAGALAQVGLPDAARGWALLLFNLGVEIGQLLFVASVWLLLGLLRRARAPVPDTALASTVLGGVAMYWTLDRLLAWSSTLSIGGWT